MRTVGELCVARRGRIPGDVCSAVYAARGGAYTVFETSPPTPRTRLETNTGRTSTRRTSTRRTSTGPDRERGRAATLASMKLRIFTEPQQGASYEQLVTVAQAAEAAGFDAFFRSDHFLTMGGDGMPGPTDSWVTLGAIARETERIRLGTLVSSATFRLPAMLAVQVAQVDAMSGGRVELGLGTGWYEAEHTAYGVPFPPLGERFERLEEQFAIIKGLWGTPRGPPSTSPASTTSSRTARRCPSRCSGHTRRSSWAAAGRSAHPAWPPPTPTNSTCRSVARRHRGPVRPGPRGVRRTWARPCHAAAVRGPGGLLWQRRARGAAPGRPNRAQA